MLLRLLINIVKALKEIYMVAAENNHTYKSPPLLGL